MITLLVGLVMPAIVRARDRANVIQCANNLRQLGLAQQMFAFENDGRLPESVFSDEDDAYDTAPDQTDHLRVDASHPKFLGGSKNAGKARWDALGHLFSREYVSEPGLFFCPAYGGPNSLDSFEKSFAGLQDGPIRGNYQSRLVSSREYLSSIPAQRALATNSISDADHLSHEDGLNVLRADVSVAWLADPSGSLGTHLSGDTRLDGDGRRSLSPVERVWELLDNGRITPITGSEGGRFSGGDMDDSGADGELEDGDR